jgi:hypothetical protein
MNSVHVLEHYVKNYVYDSISVLLLCLCAETLVKNYVCVVMEISLLCSCPWISVVEFYVLKFLCYLWRSRCYVHAGTH